MKENKTKNEQEKKNAEKIQESLYSTVYSCLYIEKICQIKTLCQIILPLTCSTFVLIQKLVFKKSYHISKTDHMTNQCPNDM